MYYTIYEELIIKYVFHSLKHLLVTVLQCETLECTILLMGDMYVFQYVKHLRNKYIFIFQQWEVEHHESERTRNRLCTGYKTYEVPTIRLEMSRVWKCEL